MIMMMMTTTTKKREQQLAREPLWKARPFALVPLAKDVSG